MKYRSTTANNTAVFSPIQAAANGRVNESHAAASAAIVIAYVANFWTRAESPNLYSRIALKRQCVRQAVGNQLGSSITPNADGTIRCA
jgi:hypothetical protein